MALQTPPSAEQWPLPFNETGLPQLDRYQRIDMLDHVEGFLPATRAELTEVTGLESVIGRAGGAAKHLGEVALRQHKTTMSDPNRTIRRLTRDYIGYTLDAKKSGAALDELGEALSGDVNPELILDRVCEPTDPGLLEFLRYFDLMTMRKEGRIDKIGYDPQKVNYVTDNPGIMFYLDQAMASWRVHQVRKRLPEARDQQTRRFDFWVQRVVEISRHYPVLRPIAEDGLDKIYNRKPVE
jgi:hypothetical protein